MHMITTKNEILCIGVNDLFTNDQCQDMPAPLEENILHFRCISLSCKHEVNNTNNT